MHSESLTPRYLPVTLRDVAQAIDCVSSGDDQALVSGVTHDSRQAKQGSLFVAIRGELFDAHKFVPQVIEQGAVGIISELEPSVEWRSLTESQSAKGFTPAVWF